MISHVGWHPAAAIMAGEAAESDSEKRRAAEWLARSCVLAPEHRLTVDGYLAVANAAEKSQLVSDLAELPDGLHRLATMIENVGSLKESGLIEAAENVPAFALATQYSKVLALGEEDERGEEHCREIIDLATTILASPELNQLFPDTGKQAEQGYYATDPQQRLWSRLLEACATESMFDYALEKAPDRFELLKRLRDQVLIYWSADVPQEKLLEALTALPEDSSLAQDTETSAAMGVIHDELKRHSEALKYLLPIVRRQRNAFLDLEGPPTYAYRVMNAAANSAIATGQSQELIEALDAPEAAFLALSSQLIDDSPADLATLCDWYAAVDAPQFWRHYYQASMAYAIADWETADSELAEAIELSADDPRLEDFGLPSLVYDFAPYSEDLWEWQELRVEMAVNCGKLQQLLAAVEDSDAFIVENGYLFDNRPDLLLEEPELMQGISEHLLTAEDAYNRRNGHAIQADLALAKGEASLAVAALLRGVEAVTAQETNNFYVNGEMLKISRLILAHDLWEQVLAAQNLTQDAEAMITLDALQAIRDSDAEEFLAAIGRYDSEYQRAAWVRSPVFVDALRKSGMWLEVNRQMPAEINTLTFASNASGVLLLDAPASELLPEMKSLVEKTGGASLEAVDVSRFPRAVAGWFADTSDGRLVAIAYDEPPIDAEHAEVERLKASYEGVLCLALIPSTDDLRIQQKLRKLVCMIGKQFPASTGYLDYTHNAWFEAIELDQPWFERLEQSAAHGVNRLRPRLRYFPWYESGPDATDDTHMRLRVGLIVEDVAVVPNPDATEDSATSTPSYILKQAPVLVPCLALGSIVN
ncbi:MAG: hypothetical protein R3C53_11485 [Pirellulaceae bacterium]